MRIRWIRVGVALGLVAALGWIATARERIPTRLRVVSLEVTPAVWEELPGAPRAVGWRVAALPPELRRVEQELAPGVPTDLPLPWEPEVPDYELSSPGGVVFEPAPARLCLTATRSGDLARIEGVWDFGLPGPIDPLVGYQQPAWPEAIELRAGTTLLVAGPRYGQALAFELE